MDSSFYVLYLTSIAVCSGFQAESEYSYLFTVIINNGYVPGQKNLTVCAAIELVEDQYYLLPKNCFDKPSSNQEIKVSIQRKKRLKFKTLVYEPFVLRWETSSDFVILEKANVYDVDIVTVPDDECSTTKCPMTHRIGRNAPGYKLTSTMGTNEAEKTHESIYEPVTRRMRYLNYKSHFKDRYRSPHRRKRFNEPFIRLPPYIQDEEKLPPRVLLTIPHGPLLTGCYILGWGTFFSKKKSLKQLEGLELRKMAVYERRPGVVDPESGFYFSEIWFERGRGQEYVDDLGSPMVCKVRNRGGVEAIIGLFMGGNSSLGHDYDFYRSFMGSFSYITYWALGTNVSITGDPASWTLWPVQYDEEPRSRGIELKFQMEIFKFNVLSLLLSFLLL